MSQKGRWRNELSGFVDKGIGGTTAMGFMLLSDVAILGAPGFTLSFISRFTT